MIYTKESPCCHHSGNGEICCWELYNLLPDDINVDVYFTGIGGLDLHNKDQLEWAFGMKEFSVLLDVIESDVEEFKTLRNKLQND